MVPRGAGRPDGPCDPRAPVQSLWGGGTGCPLEVPRPPLVVSTIRPNAGPCPEGGLSFTDERVRGHVTEVTQALSKSSKWSLRHPNVY
jgi:hypothetical protein